MNDGYLPIPRTEWEKLRRAFRAVASATELAQQLAVEAVEPATGGGSLTELTTAALAQQELRSWRRRADVFGTKEANEPAFAMLIDLFVQEKLGREVSISSACIASGVPPTTALRYICRYEDLGLLEREDDPLDRRRTNVKLTEDGRQKMKAWLSDTES